MIFAAGWVLTDFLGGVYRQTIQQQGRGDIDLIANRLSGETATVEAMVKALAGAPTILPMLVGGSAQALDRAQSVLDLDVEASGAMLGYILDSSGAVVASSNRREFALLGAPDEHTMPYFQGSIFGASCYHFALDRATGARTFYASYPVRGEDGLIVGVAVLQKSLDALEASLRHFGRSFFVIEPGGVTVLTNRPEALLRRLWPLPPGRGLTLDEPFGSPEQPTLLEREAVDASWAQFNGKEAYLLRRHVVHGQWSLIVAIPGSSIVAGRLLGIVITLQFAITALFHFFSREHGFRDSIQREQRLELQDRATGLELRATTDRLTGLYNRLKFDEVLESEIARSKRYKTPFSLVMFDIDHFKDVNDNFGHQRGDRALIELSDVVSRRVRQTDLLARWGGEEFVILVTGSTPWARAGPPKSCGRQSRSRPSTRSGSSPAVSVSPNIMKATPRTRCWRNRTARCTGPN